MNLVFKGPSLRLIIFFAVSTMLSGFLDAQVLHLEPFVQGPQRPTNVVHAGDGSGRLFLTSKLGTVDVLDGENLISFLDIRAQVNSTGSERGFHGLAFHPDYPNNGYFYVTYTNLDSDSVVSRWRVSANPNVADVESEEILLLIDQPNQWHNVSQLQFGPDGFLYIGCGDGGFAGDPGNRAQDLSELLGKILRIDVDGAFPYAIPPSNPFVGVPGARPEIWAYGVRNPWRFSFDWLTGDLYMGDVGQSSWEEVNFQSADSPGGENYGWRLMEGFHCYNPPTDCYDPSLTLPIFEHAHSFGDGECSVIGGYVYRGTRFPRFEGIYFYGDYCSGRIWAGLNVGTWFNAELLNSNLTINTFGEGEDGELYVADDDDGMIYRLIDPRPFCDLRLTQPTYQNGDVVTVASARLVNLGAQAATVRLRVAAIPPVGNPMLLANERLVLPAGTDGIRESVELATVTPSFPRGAYRLVCRLVDITNAEVIFEQQAGFTIE